MMAKIDLHNYEAWVLDYSENSLSESQKNELIQFLEKHPELKPELEEFQFVVLREEEGSLNEGFKAGLVREEFSGLIRSEHLIVAEVEGEITKKEKKELAAIVSRRFESSTLIAVPTLAKTTIYCNIRGVFEK